MKKNLLNLIGIIILAILVFGGSWVWKNFKGALPAIRKPPGDITKKIPLSTDPNLAEAVNKTGFPLKFPKGFAISIFAKDLPGARALAVDGFGNLWVSQTQEGKITQLEIQNGQVVRQNAVFRNLNRPHGLAIDIDNNVLYFAEETKITRVTLYSDDPGQKIVDLPAGGRHYTRTLHFGSDGRLYVSIGSSCDVCNEKDERLASIYSMNKDGSDFKKVASGLRNSVFMATNPVDGKLWATEMGRDNLGDNLPPDEINVIDMGPETSSGRGAEPLDFGWPICYGKNIHDVQFDKNQYIRDPCADKAPSAIDLPAHSAPLGLAFVPETPNLPEDYWLDLIVAFHGSWNRTTPTGYKLTRIKLNAKSEYEGMEDFISGWLDKDGKTALGRPVDILIQPSGIMYVSDDKAGVIYKISYLADKQISISASDSVIVESPQENASVSSPLKIIGRAKGTWYFEASFPVEVRDANNNLLGQSYAQAQAEWMTTDFVPFESTISFIKPSTDTGWLVLKKDNPSGLPEYDAEIKLPIKF